MRNAPGLLPNSLTSVCAHAWPPHASTHNNHAALARRNNRECECEEDGEGEGRDGMGATGFGVRAVGHAHHAVHIVRRT